MPDKGTQAIDRLLKTLRDGGYDVVQVGMRWRVSNPAGGGIAFVPKRLPRNAEMRPIEHGLSAIGFDLVTFLEGEEAERKAKIAADAAAGEAALTAAQAKADKGPSPADVQAAALARAEADMELMVPELGALDPKPTTTTAAFVSPFASPEGTSGPRTDVIEIDAEFAAELLKSNRYHGTEGDQRTNRRFSETVADRYADEMLSGNWQLNHQGIGITIDGLLADGQHRLAAIIKADESRPGIKVPMMVTYDLPADAGDTVDQGLRRQVAHVLSMRGEANSFNLAGALRLVAFYESGQAPSGWSNFRLLSGATGEAVLERHPEVRASVRYAARAHAGLALQTALAAAHYVIKMTTSDGQQHVADEFFKQLRTGENLTKGSPVLALRDNLLKQKTRTGLARQRNSLEHFALIIKAFNSYARGDNRVMASWRSTEPVPKVVKLG